MEINGFQSFFGVWFLFGCLTFIGAIKPYAASVKKGTDRWNLFPFVLVLCIVSGPLGFFHLLDEGELENPFTKEHLKYLVLFSPVLSLLLLWFM